MLHKSHYSLGRNTRPETIKTREMVAGRRRLEGGGAHGLVMRSNDQIWTRAEHLSPSVLRRACHCMGDIRQWLLKFENDDGPEGKKSEESATVTVSPFSFQATSADVDQLDLRVRISLSFPAVLATLQSPSDHPPASPVLPPKPPALPSPQAWINGQPDVRDATKNIATYAPFSRRAQA